MSDSSLEGDEPQLNFGVTTLGNGQAVLGADKRTYVVLGVSRGGTSAVAGTLDLLGVPMGPTGEAPLYEDLPMNKALAQDGDALDALLGQRNAENPVWGFKGNAIPQAYGDIAGRLRNPVFVVIFRDILAIANRANLSAGRDVAHILQRQNEEYQRIVDFVATGAHYAVLLSYEKLCMYPRQVISSLAEYAGLPFEPENLQSAVDFIRPAPEDYLLVSKARKKR